MRKSLKTKIQELIEYELQYSDYVTIDHVHEDEVTVGRHDFKLLAKDLSEKIAELLK